MSKSKWKVTSNSICGNTVYGIYRTIDTGAVDHSGNRENYGEYLDNREDAQAIADRLNAEEESPPKVYYFTFGTDGLFRGGWVEIHATNVADAQRKFIDYYGDAARNKNGLLRYCSEYSEKAFKETIMYENNGNHGAGCHEVIV